MNQRVEDSYLTNTFELSISKVFAIFDNLDHVVSGIGIPSLTLWAKISFSGSPGIIISFISLFLFIYFILLTLKSNKELTYRVLAQIASSVPTKLRFDQVDYNGGNLFTIQGVAASDQDILKFIENLGKQKLIEQASLSSMRLPQRSKDGITMKGFRVFVRVKKV